MPSSADHQLERALDAQTPPGLGPDAARAQRVRELVGARVQLPVGQLAARRTHGRRASGVRAACASNSSCDAASRAGSRPRCRSTPPAVCAARPSVSSGSCASRAAPGRATTAAQQRLKCPTTARSVAASNRSRAVLAVSDAARRAVSTTAASGRTWRVPRRHRRATHVSPAVRCGVVAVLQREHHLEQRASGSSRAGACSSSTSCSNGTSWCAYAPARPRRTRASNSANVGSPDRSVRSTSVFTKKPDEPLRLAPRRGSRPACRPRSRPGPCSDGAAP